MLKRYTQVPIAYLEPIFETWSQAYEQSCVTGVFFHLGGDALPRAMQYFDWMAEKFNQEIKIINMEVDIYSGRSDLKDCLEEYKDSKILLIAKKSFMTPQANALAGVIEEWYTKYGSGLLIFHEGFPSEVKKYSKTFTLLQKHIIHKIYPKEVVREFAQNVALILNYRIDDTILDEVIGYCGGIIGLVKDIVRRMKDGDNLFQDEVFKWKVEQIAKSIPQIEGIEQDLKQMGFVDSNGNWIPVLADYWATNAKAKLIVEDNYLGYEGREYTNQFSVGERKILTRLCGKSEVVSRAELGEIFWETDIETEYSDWALDAIMSRLRKKLTKIRLPIQIKTRRGHGYESV